ncbi:aldehyde dehydrogenase family protein [Thioclava sp. GXIMD4216]|uniref:aldehyde dehydrogenase family protein n=1 Tax=Thioclava sp. GXIMD4216 TaxID=3131929 RepID=UPI0030D53423
MTDLTHRPRPLFIDGLWHEGHAEARIAVMDPATSEIFARIGAADRDQTGMACAAAARAFPAWRSLAGAARAQVLEGFAQGLRARHAALVSLQMRNNGKPRAEAELDLADAAACFDYYAGLARALDSPAPVQDLSEDGLTGRGLAHAVGPVGLIVPWNFPLVTSAWKIAPALAAGCSVVLKLSEMTPLAELVYGDIAAEMGLPSGVLNILTGFAEVGQALCDHPQIAKLSFTGSNPVGAQVMEAAARRIVPVSLELGGKSPIVVMADADPARAAELVLDGIFMNAGQMCSATSRLIVEAPIAPDLIDAVVEGARARRLGVPDGAQMGPITTAPQYRHVLEHFARAKAEGARCLTGGAARKDLAGQFVAPTVYADVPTDSFLWRAELFGPILSVRQAASEHEAIALANDTEFGLAATVVTADAARGQRIASQIAAGHIWVNAPQIILPQSQWGGFRASGIGRELGPAGLQAYQQRSFITTQG